jgi:hypothetical protein
MKRLIFLLVFGGWLFLAALAAAQTKGAQEADLYQKVQRICDTMQSLNKITMFTLDLIQKAVGEHDYYYWRAQKIKISVLESDALVAQAQKLLAQANEIKETDEKQALEKIDQLLDIADRVKTKTKNIEEKLAELINALVKQPAPSPKIKI